MARRARLRRQLSSSAHGARFDAVLPSASAGRGTLYVVLGERHHPIEGLCRRGPGRPIEVGRLVAPAE